MAGFADGFIQGWNLVGQAYARKRQDEREDERLQWEREDRRQRKLAEQSALMAGDLESMLWDPETGGVNQDRELSADDMARLARRYPLVVSALDGALTVDRRTQGAIPPGGQARIVGFAPTPTGGSVSIIQQTDAKGNEISTGPATEGGSRDANAAVTPNTGRNLIRAFQAVANLAGPEYRKHVFTILQNQAKYKANARAFDAYVKGVAQDHNISLDDPLLQDIRSKVSMGLIDLSNARDALNAYAGKSEIERKKDRLALDNDRLTNEQNRINVENLKDRRVRDTANRKIQHDLLDMEIRRVEAKFGKRLPDDVRNSLYDAVDSRGLTAKEASEYAADAMGLTPEEVNQRTLGNINVAEGQISLDKQQDQRDRDVARRAAQPALFESTLRAIEKEYGARVPDKVRQQMEGFVESGALTAEEASTYTRKLMGMSPREQLDYMLKVQKSLAEIQKTKAETASKGKLSPSEIRKARNEARKIFVNASGGTGLNANDRANRGNIVGSLFDMTPSNLQTINGHKWIEDPSELARSGRVVKLMMDAGVLNKVRGITAGTAYIMSKNGVSTPDEAEKFIEFMQQATTALDAIKAPPDMRDERGKALVAAAAYREYISGGSPEQAMKTAIEGELARRKAERAPGLAAETKSFAQQYKDLLARQRDEQDTADRLTGQSGAYVTLKRAIGQWAGSLKSSNLSRAARIQQADKLRAEVMAADLSDQQRKELLTKLQGVYDDPAKGLR